MSKLILKQNQIEERIFIIRGKKVMLDRDLAYLYGVETRSLNQAVKRNLRRFPEDFMFQLTQSEVQEVITNCDKLKNLKFSPANPYAFTEHGILMLSSVLNSDKAIRTCGKKSRTWSANMTLSFKWCLERLKTFPYGFQILKLKE
jgi:hypothetical protein